MGRIKKANNKDTKNVVRKNQEKKGRLKGKENGGRWQGNRKCSEETEKNFLLLRANHYAKTIKTCVFVYV